SNWPNPGHRRRIAERLEALRELERDPLTASVPASFERFLRAIEGTPSFLENLAAKLAVRAGNGDDKWLELVPDALIGLIALLIDVDDDDFRIDACDPRQVGPVSEALSHSTSRSNTAEGVCALTGKTGELHAGNFPQPNLPGLGQTYLFSRNKDIPSL